MTDLICPSCGNIKGHKEKSPCHPSFRKETPIHSSYAHHEGAAILIRARSTGAYLIQERGPGTSSNQGKWDITAVGHREKGEEPLDTALRELEEELGIVPQMFILGSITWIRTDPHWCCGEEIRKRRMHAFLAECEEQYSPQPPDPEIVSDWTWMTEDDVRELAEWQATRPFLAELPYLLRLGTE